jgi:hypothetical protein
MPSDHLSRKPQANHQPAVIVTSPDGIPPAMSHRAAELVMRRPLSESLEKLRLAQKALVRKKRRSVVRVSFAHSSTARRNQKKLPAESVTVSTRRQDKACDVNKDKAPLHMMRLNEPDPARIHPPASDLRSGNQCLSRNGGNQGAEGNQGSSRNYGNPRVNGNPYWGEMPRPSMYYPTVAQGNMYESKQTGRDGSDRLGGEASKIPRRIQPSRDIQTVTVPPAFSQDEHVSTLCYPSFQEANSTRRSKATKQKRFGLADPVV